jgi:DnaK suppressor protein
MTAKKKYTKKELEEFKQIIIDKRAQAIEEISSIENTVFSSGSTQGGELSGLANHMADAASDINTLETTFDLAAREGKYLVYLEEALTRIEAGTYGICKGCSSLIPKRRLEVVPTATRCVGCKQNTKVQERHEQTDRGLGQRMEVASEEE